ncbi:MAG: autoinducer synthesis protein [Alphaproteobacteria bacterium]|nr:autoinducer synthesis protein [Alphaproteobacteria bacterium]MBM3642164.1 autoinducer synthesis protein [Alphaproteobacteria bacterium]
MITLLPGESRARFPRFTDEMYELRLGASRARLDRPLGAINRLAVVDYFDSLDPLYVLALDDAGRIIGAIRLLPTTGATMLNDAFAATLPERGRIESPLIWEASRLTVDATGNSQAQERTIDRAVGELGCALNEIAQGAGLTHLIGVFDGGAYNLLSSRGCAGEALAPPLSLAGGQIFVAFYEVGPAMDAQFIRLAGENARRPINLADVDSTRSAAGKR